MAVHDVQRYDLALLRQHVSVSAGARVLEMGYHDPAAAQWAAAQGAHVVALRPAVDLTAELERAPTPAAGRIEVRLALRPAPEEAQTFDLALLLAPFFLGNAPVRDAIRAAAAALRPGGALYFQVHRRRGGDTFVRMAGEVFGTVEQVDIGGGQRRLYRATQPAALPIEDPPAAAGPLREVVHGGATVRLRLGAGVFASHDVDPGSRLLLATLGTAEIAPGASVLDLGCGAGTLGLAIAAAGRRVRVVLVDSSRPAVDLARENAERNGLHQVEVVLGDGYAAVQGQRFDAIVANLPAHRGYQAEDATALRFIGGAPAHLREDGAAWVVANKALPYELPASRAFREVRLAGADGRYKVLHCTKPQLSGPRR